MVVQKVAWLVHSLILSSGLDTLGHAESGETRPTAVAATPAINCEEFSLETEYMEVFVMIPGS
ncbi:Uncharacterized protein DAT39_006683 [Clarias magur]|uniref:Uncharacterized protein n=1 Tax=Clarias magur TaxID=1594786 RepID=A0A8J4X6B6_CLAMG|nr:Uncharacterized protein DAT39_006683 [Clarias magur]